MAACVPNLEMEMMKRLRRVGLRPLRLVIGALGAVLACGAPAAEPVLSVNLNKLEQAEDSCRAYLLVRNPTPASFPSFKLDIVLFDTEDVVRHRLLVQIGPVLADKTTLNVFRTDFQACEHIGSMLLNSVPECDDGSGAPVDCLSLVSVGSGAPVPFVR